jgi:hypothetical protein
VAAALLMAIVSGCATPRTILSNVTEEEVSVDHAFVSLGPGAPAVLFLTERPYANGARQTMRLATHGMTPGENSLRVDVVGLTNSNVDRQATLPDSPLSEPDLISEAEEGLPNVPLRTSLTYVQNRYGPFGYAVGRSTQGDECIYAWQRLTTPNENLSVVNSRDTLSVRLRVCAPHVSEARLVAIMMGLSVNVGLSGGSWTPEPKQLSSQIGAAGVSIGPSEILTAATNPIPEAPSHPARRLGANQKTGANSTEPPTAANPPPSGAVIVPPPVASADAQGPIVPPPPDSANTSPEPKP